MKKLPLCAGFFALAILAFAASTWEGSAVVAGSADFPIDGFYGACNSFPLNSSVQVENLETGRKLSVTITKNIENPAIFMTLAPKAAAELGMKAGASARVRVLAQMASATPAPPGSPKSVESNDPDYNPRLLASIQSSKSPADSADSTALAGILENPQAGDKPSLGEAQPSPASEALASPINAVPAVALSPVLGKPDLAADGGNPPADALPSPELAVPAVSSTASAGERIGDNGLVLDASVAPGKPGAPETAKGLLDLPEAPVSLTSKPELGSVAINPPGRTVASAELGLPEIATAAPKTEGPPEAVDLDAPQPLPGIHHEVALASPLPLVESAENAESPGVADPRPLLPLGSVAGAGLELPSPELGPDLIPEAELARLANPPSVRPDIALADSIVELGGSEKPEIVLSLEATAPRPPEKAEALKTPEEAKPEMAAALSGGAPSSSPATLPLVATPPQPPAIVPPKALPLAAAAQPVTPPVEKPKENSSAAAVQAKPALPVASAPSAAAVALAPTSKALVPGMPAKEPTELAKLEATMKKGNYYVQIGLFASEDALRVAIAKTAAVFPVVYETVSVPRIAYRLYVGPLSRDESGMVLQQVKGLGYKDAFIKAI